MEVNNLALSKNYHISSCGYSDAAELLIIGYTKAGISKDTILPHQILPLYYLLQMAIEMFLKARLIINGIDPKKLKTRGQGHNLEWLLAEFKKFENSIDKYFESMVLAIGSGEFRYPDIFTGHVRIEMIDEIKCIGFLKKYIQENHIKLQEINNATN
jgi:hypothetical protein